MANNPKTLKQLTQTLGAIRGGDRFLRRAQVDSFESFVDALYDDLDAAIQGLEQNPKERQRDTEDRLTLEIINILKQLGYIAEHDAQSGGHVDITVSHCLKDWSWLGEAKHYDSVGDLRQGFNQLCTRYANGAPGRDHGGLIAYLKRPNAKRCMELWSEELGQMNLRSLQIKDCARRKHLAFISAHEHNGSGLPYKVRHVCVLLHFDPQDGRGKSGLPT